MRSRRSRYWRMGAELIPEGQANPSCRQMAKTREVDKPRSARAREKPTSRIASCDPYEPPLAHSRLDRRSNAEKPLRFRRRLFAVRVRRRLADQLDFVDGLDLEAGKRRRVAGFDILRRFHAEHHRDAVFRF